MKVVFFSEVWKSKIKTSLRAKVVERAKSYNDSNLFDSVRSFTWFLSLLVSLSQSYFQVLKDFVIFHRPLAAGLFALGQTQEGQTSNVFILNTNSPTARPNPLIVTHNLRFIPRAKQCQLYRCSRKGVNNCRYRPLSYPTFHV